MKAKPCMIQTLSLPVLCVQLLENKLLQNKGKDEILAFIEEKYGDEIFLKPAFKEETILIWLAPFILLIIGIFILQRILRKQENLQ